MVDIAQVHEARTGYLHALGLVCARIVNEYRRAMAAEDHYAGLKRKSASALAREGMAHGDIPRGVFEQFYSTHVE